MNAVNDKIYIHEFININGHNRANYMHHMTANFSPAAQEDRHQLCFGVWGVLGSTGRWPEVVNIWEEDGFDGIARSFGFETGHASLQDPKLAKWWAEAQKFRSGGLDRLIVPAPWTRTIETLCADGVRGTAYAHELVKVKRGAAADFLELVRTKAVDAYATYGWELAGAWQTAMIDDSECILLWAIPQWEQWAAFEKAQFDRAGFGKGEFSGALAEWKNEALAASTSWERILLVDSPLSPMKIGRQPQRSDQTGWDE